MVLVPIQEPLAARSLLAICSHSLVGVLMAFSLCVGLGYAQPPCVSIEVFFSPKGGCTDAIVREISVCKKTVLVQAYLLTSGPVCKALLDAHKRGVEVKVILDKRRRGAKYSELDFFDHAGIAVRIDARHGHAHDKVMVVDGGVVITGSFNFSVKAEESNAENLVIIRGEQVAGKYAANWNTHWEHSEKDLSKTRR